MEKRVKESLKNISCTLEIINKKVDIRLNEILDKNYGFEPEDDQEYFNLDDIKNLSHKIHKMLSEIQKPVKERNQKWIKNSI